MPVDSKRKENKPKITAREWLKDRRDNIPFQRWWHRNQWACLRNGRLKKEENECVTNISKKWLIVKNESKFFFAFFWF